MLTIKCVTVALIIKLNVVMMSSFTLDWGTVKSVYERVKHSKSVYKSVEHSREKALQAKSGRKDWCGSDY